MGDGCCGHTLRDISHFKTAIKNFRTEYYERHPELMKRLNTEGQAPATLIIACCDSRVETGLLMQAKPGELFTARNVANLVPPYEPDEELHGTSAAIEYAVRDLQVDHIIVLGHAQCGGIRAMITKAMGKEIERDFIGPWVSLAHRATELYVNGPDGYREPISLELLEQHPSLVERAAISGSLNNLLTYPWIKSEVEAGRLALYGWWFDTEPGDLWTAQSPEAYLRRVSDDAEAPAP